MLSKRLKTVSNLIDSNLNFADIGCDHGYLAIDIIKKGTNFVQLIDNKIGPLKVAQNNLLNLDINTEVVYTLADGLTQLDARVQVVAICGMGGDLIIKIIKDSIEKAKNLDYLVLEANSKVSNLRAFLNENKFRILDEEFVVENKKNYQIMKVSYQYSPTNLSEKQIEFGPCLINKMSNEYICYLRKRYCYLSKIIKSVTNDNKYKFDKELKMIKEILDDTKTNI